MTKFPFFVHLTKPQHKTRAISKTLLTDQIVVHIQFLASGFSGSRFPRKRPVAAGHAHHVYFYILTNIKVGILKQ